MCLHNFSRDGVLCINLMAYHFAAFLDYDCSHFAERIAKPFNFVRTSRIRNIVAPDLKFYLTNVLRNTSSIYELKSSAVPLVASSLLLDSYPPGLHCESTPQ